MIALYLQYGRMLLVVVFQPIPLLIQDCYPLLFVVNMTNFSCPSKIREQVTSFSFNHSLRSPGQGYRNVEITAPKRRYCSLNLPGCTFDLSKS